MPKEFPKGDNEPNTIPRNKQRMFKVFLISLLVFAVWIWGLNWLFSHYRSKNYFTWYIKNGTLVSIVTAFFALVWQGLEEQKDLLSWHPAKFLASCTALAAVFYAALAVNLAGPMDGMKQLGDDSISKLESLWDSTFAIMMDVLMALAVLGWLLVIAPLFDLLTLFTGAPARREIRDTGRRLIVKTEGSTTSITEQSSSAEISNGSMDVSLGTRPFALTNALNAAVLFFLERMIPGAG